MPLFPKRQPQYDSRAFFRLAVDVDSAIVLLHDFAHDRQPQSDAEALGAEQRFEQPFHVFGSDAGAGVGHADFDAPGANGAGDCQAHGRRRRLAMAAVGQNRRFAQHRFAGIVDDIDQTAQHALAVDFDKGAGAEIVPSYKEIATKRIRQEIDGTLRTRPMDKPVYDPELHNNKQAVSPWSSGPIQTKLFERSPNLQKKDDS